MNLIRELHEQGNTIILITHDNQIAANAPRQIQLMDGKIIRDTKDTWSTDRRTDEGKEEA